MSIITWFVLGKQNVQAKQVYCCTMEDTRVLFLIINFTLFLNFFSLNSCRSLRNHGQYSIQKIRVVFDHLNLVLTFLQHEYEDSANVTGCALQNVIMCLTFVFQIISFGLTTAFTWLVAGRYVHTHTSHSSYSALRRTDYHFSHIYSS